MKQIRKTMVLDKGAAKYLASLTPWWVHVLWFVGIPYTHSITKAHNRRKAAKEKNNGK